MAYLKSQMMYSDYSWKSRYANDDPSVRGVPDSTLLNRSEGYEMLYFINRLAKIWNWGENVPAMQRLETIIRTKVPSNQRSHEHIRIWIEQNYTNI